MFAIPMHMSSPLVASKSDASYLSKKEVSQIVPKLSNNAWSHPVTQYSFNHHLSINLNQLTHLVKFSAKNESD